MILTNKFIKLLKAYPKQFWVLNLLQMIEKLAYWIVLLQMPIYIAQKDAAGGLQWGQTTKGFIFFGWAAVQNLSPLIFGAWADRYGRKRLLFVSFIFIISGYLLLGISKDFYPFAGATILLALGSGMFKPALQGAIASNLNEKNSSTGWGIYFMLLNLAVFFGPAVSKYLKEISWEMVFWGSAGIFALNILILFLGDYSPRQTLANIPKDKDASIASETGIKSFLAKCNGFVKGFFRDIDSNLSQTETVEKNEISGDKAQCSEFPKRKSGVLANLFMPQIFWFIIIMSGFMTIYMQFYETLPNFLIDWTDTTSMAASLGLPDFMLMETERGIMISYEWLYTLNSLLIIAFIVIISRLFSGVNRLKAVATGIILSTLGLFLSGASMYGILTVSGIVVYTFGEMITNPKFTEYLGRIAPKNNKSMYLSYLNISLAIGLGFGSLIGGFLYGRYGEKATLAANYLHTHFDIHTEIDPQNAMNIFCEKSGLSVIQATEFLWDHYDPYLLWLPFLLIGLSSFIGILVYQRKSSII